MDGIREGGRLAPGSLPLKDPIEAVQTQFRAFPEIPAWPQLPKKSEKEQMNRQGLSGLPGLSWPTDDQPVFTLSKTDTAEAIETLKTENQGNRLSRAAFKQDEASGFFAFLDQAPRLISAGVSAVKGQIAGPITLGLTIRDEAGKPLLASRESMGVLVEYLVMHCRWQVQKLSMVRKPVVFFLDEPFLGGNFQPEPYGLEWKDIQALLGKVLEALQDDGVLTGIHSCGPGPWDWLYETPVEIFHFDGFKHMGHVLEQPQKFGEYIHKGGMVVWGMVPTEVSKGGFSHPDELFHQWVDAYEILVKKGLSREELIGRSFFSTSCGLANSSVRVMEESIRCLGSLVSLWRSNISLK